MRVCGDGASARSSPLRGWAQGGAAVAIARYAGVLLFSAVGGLVPGTLFSLGVRVAPDESTVSTTVGWMQQCSALGQFAGPPLAGLGGGARRRLAGDLLVTGAFALAGDGDCGRHGPLPGRVGAPSQSRQHRGAS